MIRTCVKIMHLGLAYHNLCFINNIEYILRGSASSETHWSSDWTFSKPYESPEDARANQTPSKPIKGEFHDDNYGDATHEYDDFFVTEHEYPP